MIFDPAIFSLYVNIGNITPTLPLPEGVKKLISFFFTSFRRKPESSVFKTLAIDWTPVFTGVTAEIQFFHTFPRQGGGNFIFISTGLPSPPQGKGRVRG